MEHPTLRVKEKYENGSKFYKPLDKFSKNVAERISDGKVITSTQIRLVRNYWNMEVDISR